VERQVIGGITSRFTVYAKRKTKIAYKVVHNKGLDFGHEAIHR
jgi:hypothetical protein